MLRNSHPERMLGPGQGNCVPMSGGEKNRVSRRRDVARKAGRADLFDVPDGYLLRHEALLQIFMIPGGVALAGLGIALIASCS